MTMSRFLTAQKIGLVVLVKLYCDSALPSSATIPVLSFILTHSIAPVASNARNRPVEPQNSSYTIEAFERVLQGHTSSMPGRTLLDVFLKHMWEINSFDALHDLFHNIDGLFVKQLHEHEHDHAVQDRILLTKTSPLGTFVRRARLEFTRLQFDDALKLWAAFIRYRAPTAHWTKRLAGLALSGVDINATSLGIEPGHPLFDVAYGDLSDEEHQDNMSLDDIDRLLAYQLDQLQKLGCRVPDPMREQLQKMFKSNGIVLGQSHLVTFFDAWKAGDYTSAFDNLHRYYDYAMQTREKIHYQYALLHMAILQADFGCFGEAIAAINETIATARENQDMICLNFSLSWLNHMTKACPKQMKGAGYMGMLGSERDGLTFLKTKAKESKMHNLLSATLLNESRLCLATGESVSRALEYMYQASHLHIRENINNHGSHMLLQSTLYSRLGIAHLSNVYCDLLLNCYNNDCPADERVRALCRTAFGAAQSGQYDQAIVILESVNTASPPNLKHYQYVYYCIALIKLKRAIRLTDWQGCSALLESLQPTSTTDPELAFILQETRIAYYTARGLYPDAFNAIEDLAFSLREESADISQRITMLLAKAELFAKAGRPEQGFSIALRAASVSHKARLMPKLWEAIGRIGNILNAVGEFEGARRMLDAALPHTLEFGDHMLTGMLASNISDSYVGLAGLDDHSTPLGLRSRAANLSRAERHIDFARESFKKAEDIDGECEQLMKKAILAKLRGDEKLAEEWAQNHNRVWEGNQVKIGTDSILS